MWILNSYNYKIANLYMLQKLHESQPLKEIIEL